MNAALFAQKEPTNFLNDDDDLQRPTSRRHHWRHYHHDATNGKWVFVDIAQEEPDFTKAAEFFVIYREPPDYPDKYVVRRWLIEGGERYVEQIPFSITDTLESARRSIQPVPRRSMGRYEDPEDPSVFEAWM